MLNDNSTVGFLHFCISSGDLIKHGARPYRQQIFVRGKRIKTRGKKVVPEGPHENSPTASALGVPVWYRPSPKGTAEIQVSFGRLMRLPWIFVSSKLTPFRDSRYGLRNGGRATTLVA